jgi:uncharacterized protein (TIRG00374 family)
VYYISFLFRGLRWRLLIQNAGVNKERGERLPSLMECSEGILLGWFVNSVAWLRLGDLYRGYLLSQLTGIRFSTGMGTVLAERMVDIFVMFSLLALSTLAFVEKQNDNVLIILGAASGLLIIAILGLLAMRYFGLALAARLPHRLATWYLQFHRGTLGSLRQMPALFMVSVVIWLVDSSRLLLVIYGLDLRDSIDMSTGFLLLFALFAALAHSILTTIPLTPGGLGFVEAGLAGILVIEVSRLDALAVALVERSITYASTVVFGALVFLSREMRRRRATAVTDTGAG